MKLLWISPRWPYPADDGAKRASAALVDALAGLGHEIFVLTFAREEKLAPAPHGGVRLLAHYRAPPLTFGSRLRSALRSLPGPLPVSAAPFARFGLTWRSAAALMPGEPDAVVLDGCHGIAAFAGEACPWPTVYRAHNVETSLWEQAAARSWLRPYLSAQASRMRALEGHLGSKACGIAAISPEDAASFRAWFPRTPVEWVPVGFPCAEPSPLAPGPLTLGYLGRMDWPPNRDGLKWFLERVWPEFRRLRPDARLRIAGSGDAGWLSSYAGLGFEWLGRIESVSDFYAVIHAAIVPVQYGGGTKIKLVEAACHGRAAFATSAAQQGSGLSRGSLAAVADSSVTWIGALVPADPAQLAQVGQAAFREARGIFGAAAAAERFLSLLPREAGLK